MDSLSDQQLLRDYAERRSEAAFAQLVRRHVDLVYSAALRMVRDAHLAEDVAQGAFLALAQNARQLTDRPVLSGWLHCTARNLAAKVVRTDARRRARESRYIGTAMNELLAAEADASWDHLAPHLDAALGELSETDRDAVVLRYFEGKSAHEMAQVLGVSDDAAQKRVTRAVERLREFLAQRGVSVGAGGLAVLLAANAVQSAPSGLAITISAAATLAGTTVSTSTALAATKAIAMTTIQKTIIGAAFIVTIGTGIYEARQASQLRQQVRTLQQQQTPLAAQIKQLQRERDEATNQTALLASQIEEGTAKHLELLKLRGEIGVLRQRIAELQRPLQGGDSLANPQTMVDSRFNPEDYQITTYPDGPDDILTNGYGHPFNYSFPASPTQRCSIHGLLNQCMEVSGWRYLIDKDVATGSVNFGSPNVLNGAEWVAAFEQALQTGAPEWLDRQSHRIHQGNLVLLRYPDDKTVLVLPADKAINYRYH